MKVMLNQLYTEVKCRLCERIDAKLRRRVVEVERLNRLQQEGSVAKASTNHSTELIRQLDAQIDELRREKLRRTGIRTPTTPAPLPMPKETVSNETRVLELEETRANLVDGKEDRKGCLNLYSGEPDGNTHDLAPIKDHLNEPETIRRRSDIETENHFQYRLVDKRNLMFGLPITFESVPNPATVMAVPDTGADENIISLGLALDLGLDVELDEKYETKLMMINKRYSQCCGLARAVCGFGTTSHLGPSGLSCVFRVSETTISPLIMSNSFLMATQTLTKYRHRLVSLASSILRLPCVRAFGRARERLCCSLNGEVIEAFPDSGSEVDLISYDYATYRGLTILSTTERIMLADGSIEKAAGVCSGQLTVGSGSGSIIDLVHIDKDHNNLENTSAKIGSVSLPDSSDVDDTDWSSMNDCTYRNVINTKFYVLYDMSTDLLLGAASLESLQVYTHHQDQLTMSSSYGVDDASLNRIVLLGKMGKILRRAASSAFGSSPTVSSSPGNTFTPLSVICLYLCKYLSVPRIRYDTRPNSLRSRSKRKCPTRSRPTGRKQNGR